MSTYIIDPSGFNDPAAPTVAELEQAVQDFSCAEVTGYSREPAPFVLTEEMLRDAFTQARQAPQYAWGVWDARYRAKVLGHWEYTPQDELRDRLNDRLQVKKPALAVNTRYWRGL